MKDEIEATSGEEFLNEGKTQSMATGEQNQNSNPNPNPNPFLAMYNLWNQIPLDDKLHLETEIRNTKQRGESIEKLFYDMDRLWYQMTPNKLMKSATFRKFEDENRTIQFLLALRHEFEPFKMSLLSRSTVPSLPQVIIELLEEEARLRSSHGYLETNTDVVEEDEDESFSAYLERKARFDDEEELMFSSLKSPSMSTEENREAISSPAVDHSAASSGEKSQSGKGFTSNTIKILTYNVCIWDIELDQRTKALSDLIQLHTPDIICFQEVRLESYNIFRQSSWWNEYKSSIPDEEAAEPGRLDSHFRLQLSKLPTESFSSFPFRNSKMGRELCLAEIKVSGGKTLIVATCHLESPNIFRRMYTKERIAQAKQSLRCLECFENVVLAGDMNWNEELEGEFPIREGWVDAWQKLRPGEKGLTCDTNSNPMMSANRPLTLRLDRILCKLNEEEFRLVKISMIGKEAIPGVFHSKQKRQGNRMQTLKLPVLPSDHYGLLLEISCN